MYRECGTVRSGTPAREMHVVNKTRVGLNIITAAAVAIELAARATTANIASRGVRSHARYLHKPRPICVTRVMHADQNEKCHSRQNGRKESAADKKKTTA